ncbi:MAG: nucleotidyltransferase [Elusimicrobia bacterium]|nr:nucleotidyltransferase [Elusimicrobiota bacterium]
MITIHEAFGKFKSRLELTTREQEDASRRHNRIRELLREELDIDRDFLTGSYARWTKTKPLKDIDIFFVLGEKELHYRQKPPHEVLERFRKVLVPEYGETNVHIRRRSVQVDFGVQVIEDDSQEKVMSIDVVPAVTAGHDYEIPDTQTGSWVKTNPETHAELTTKANKAFSEEWKPLVKMIKKWNETNAKVIKPSFLIEVMALQLFVPPFSEGDYPYELKTFLSTAADRIGEVWEDPGKLGPPVSDQMDGVRVAQARETLRKAEVMVSQAIRLAKDDRNGDALRAWRDFFGPLFPLS